MTKKTKMGIVYVFSGMLWMFIFGMSETKITDMWFPGIAVLTTCSGLKKLLEGHDAPTAQFFERIATTSTLVTIGLLVLSFISGLL